VAEPDAEAYARAVQDAVARALAEDLGPEGDLTSALVPEDVRAQFALRARRAGVLAGRACATEAFRIIGPDVDLQWLAADGDELALGDTVLHLAGPLRPILTAERTALNFLGRLSGVASMAARAAQAVAGTRARVLDTRKTTPGLRALEKAAVAAGGACNHRAGLFDAILIKENHIAAAGGIGNAVQLARRAAPQLADTLEVEVRNRQEIEEALAANAPRLLLDNMSVDELAAAVQLVAGRALLEASGGVTLTDLREVAQTGVDFISLGALTHSAPALDLSMLLEAL
jgi:nicotinate-nucleotide pyrophosphorylase (carboxylating)